jgi:hypothetical protein
MKTSPDVDTALCVRFQGNVGMPARSALIVRTQLNPYEPGTMALDATLGRRVIAIAAG